MPLYLFLVGLWVSATAAQDCSKTQVSTNNGHLVLKYPAFSGLEEVGYHYNVNHDVTGTNAADNNYEVTRNAGGFFTLQTSTPARNGDKVNFWLYFKVNGVGTVISDCHATVGHAGTGTGNHQTGSTTTTTSPHTGSGTHSNPGNRHLVWHEPFDGPNIDMTKWKHEVSAFGGGNWEFQTYTPDPENSYIKNGVLYIRPTLLADKFGDSFMNSGDAPLPPTLSAKLISKYSFKYGRMEVVAKMPLGDWLWPTIWLWPRDDAYGSWPRSGEIDLVETRGNMHYGNIGIQRIMSTLHYGPVNSDGGFQDAWPKSTAEKFSPSGTTWADDFHTYFIDWTPDHIQYALGVDNDVILNFPTPSNGYWGYGSFSGTNPWTQGGKDAPFDKEMVIQLNVAVGGTLGFFPDNVQNQPYPKPWCNSCPDAGMANRKFWEAKDQWYPTWHGERCAMQIKDIKVFQ
ncbi:hypothetical protein BaRGS_00022979 [Batillaria attramentaria]|uniref:GH16 domain-containing protein n=1 Tax=Batillaria attramentaria TaxID=370345 RepID=A0ABD0KF05_9CAEN